MTDEAMEVGNPLEELKNLFWKLIEWLLLRTTL